MTNTEKIEKWKVENPTFGLILPSGWFGRPFDNNHNITWTADRKFKILIEVDQQLLFILTKSKQFEIKNDGNDLVFKNFYRLTFDSLGYGDLTAHTEYFDTGELKLVAYK